MPEKKERAEKFHISTKDNKEPLVLLASDAKDAAAKWAKKTGKDAKDATVTKLGTMAESITRPKEPVAESLNDNPKNK